MQPIKSKRVLVKLGTETVGVVEGLFSEATKLGGVAPNYKNNTGKHVKGSVVMSFNLRRWMYVDPNKKRLLYDLWKNKMPFTLHFGLHDGDYEDYESDTEFEISGCVAYRWKPITGSANAIIGEEIVGEGIDISWLTPCPCSESDEMITNGDFETGDTTGWTFTGASISTSGECEGTYCASFGVGNSIEQTLVTEMPVVCIDSFSLFARYLGCGSANYSITITYIDDTTTTISGSTSSSCVEIDILSSLESDKTVKKIKIECTSVSSSSLKIDAVSLLCKGGGY